MKSFSGLTHLTTSFIDLFWGIGYFGWQISVLFALYILYTYSSAYSWVPIIIYLFVFLLCGWFNQHIFKMYIKDPRPLNSQQFLSSEHFIKHANGMPSGHAQQTAFSLTVAYLVSNKYLYESLFLMFIAVLQRYTFHNHTIWQLLAGSILGVIIGYITFLVIHVVIKK